MADRLQSLLELGRLLTAQQRYPEAESCYRRLLELRADDVDAQFGLTGVLQRSGRLPEARESCRQLLQLDPEHAGAWCVLAGLLLADGRETEEAEQCLRRAVALDPGFTAAHYNLGVLMAELGRSEAAAQSYRQALACDPQYLEARYNLGVLLADNGSSEEAETCYRKVLEQDPGFAMASRNLASILLQQGRFAEGWRHYEARYSPRLPRRTVVAPEPPFPQWRGESLAGKSVLVWPEQGFGDQIQLCRYVPLLKRQGAAWVTLVCPPELSALFASLPGVDRVVPEETPGPVPSHDYWTLLLSIPYCLGGAEDRVPDSLPYLAVPAPRRDAPGLQLQRGTRRRVGLVWRGGSLFADNHSRSLPDLASLAPLWAIAGIDFFSLQKGEGEQQAACPPPDQPLQDLGSRVRDFAETAGILEQLDLLICVDTAIAHLAGSLGINCWVMLPAQPDWRWLSGRDDTPWYPRCLRLFRQERPGDWEPVVLKVREALRLWMG
jgi:Flp pilus assembly protein TadD